MSAFHDQTSVFAEKGKIIWTCKNNAMCFVVACAFTLFFPGTISRAELHKSVARPQEQTQKGIDKLARGLRGRCQPLRGPRRWSSARGGPIRRGSLGPLATSEREEVVGRRKWHRYYVLGMAERWDTSDKCGNIFLGWLSESWFVQLFRLIPAN